MRENRIHNLHYEKFQDGTVKCIEDEIPFELPEGWAWARMLSLTQDLPYGTSKKSSSSGEIAVLRMGNLQQGEVDYSDLVYSSDKEDIDKYLLTYGDLLFNRTNSSEWVGKTSIYRGEIPAIYAGYLIRIRSFLDAEYLNSVMNSKYAKEICLMVKTDAVNQSNINATKLGRFLIPVPPFSEQIRISDMVSEALYWNNFIESNKLEIKQSIQQIKSKVLDLAIRGKLVHQDSNDEPASVLLERIRTEKEELINQGKIKRDKKESIIFKGDDNSYYENLPKNWENVPLNMLCWLENRGKTEGRKLPYLDAKTLRGSVNKTFISKGIVLKNGEKAILVDGENSGEVFTISYDGYMGSTFKPLSFSNYINQKYILLIIQNYKELLKNNKTGSAIPHLNKNIFNSLPVGLPPLEEQNRICEAVDKIFITLDIIERSLN